MVTCPAFSPTSWASWQLGKVIILMRKPRHLNRKLIGDYSHPVYQDLLKPLTAQYSQFQPWYLISISANEIWEVEWFIVLNMFTKLLIFMCGLYISQLSCIHFHVTECKYIPWMNVKCHVYFWVQVHRAIGAFYSKSNYIQSPVCNLPSWEVSSQIHSLKANNQTARSASLFHTRHCKCLSMILCFHTDKKMIESDSLSNWCFYKHAVLLVPRSSLFSCFISS